MGQLIACATAEGVLLASDSRAIMFEPGGEERPIKVERLVPVTTHAALASAGNWEATDICRDFAKFVKDEGLTDIDAMIEAAIPFFTGRIDEVLRKMCETMPPDPVVNMYLVLAGYAGTPSDRPSRLFVIWDRPKPPKIEYNQVTNIFTLPRRMSLEYKLNQLVKEKAPLTKITQVAKSEMERYASQDDLIGPPYHYWIIDGTGINKS